VSFLLISSYHVNFLRRKYDVREGIIDVLDRELLFKPYLTNVDLAIAHPCLYPFAYRSYSEAYTKFFEIYNNSIGIDTADSDKINPDYKYLLDKFTALIVPSKFAKKSYQYTKTTTPIHVVPHGLDPGFYRKKMSEFTNLRVQQIANIPKKKVLFFYWHSEHRKGIDLTEQIANRVLQERDDVCFVMKSRGGKAKPNIPNLQVVTGDYSYSDIVQLYDSCDVLLHTARGGGFELNCLEALARNLVVLYPKNSAIQEYAQPYAIAIDSRKKDQPLPNNRVHIGLGHTIDVEDGVKKLNDALDNLDYYKAQTEEFPKYNYTWDRVGEQLSGVIEGIIS